MDNKKWFGLEALFNKAFNDNTDTLKVDTTRKRFKDAFGGTMLDLTKWNLVQAGAGMNVSVSGNSLQITTGTTTNSETIIQSVDTYGIPNKALFGLMLSQAIANQEFYIELVSADPNSGVIDGLNAAAWKFSGTDATKAAYQVQNGGAARLDSGSVAITNPLSSYSIKEIDMLNDSVWFYDRVIDSGASASNTFVRHQQTPDPNARYAIRIRIKNLSVAPASNTTMTIQVVTAVGFGEVTTENINQSQASSSGGSSGNVVVTAALPAGGNNIGSVNISGNVGISGNLPAGSNVIGKVDINSIPEVEIKNDLGNPLQVSFPTLPVGSNLIGNVGITGNVTVNALPTGANTIGTVNIGTMPEVQVKGDIANPVPVTFSGGALPAGANNIGKVDINSIPEVEIKNDAGNPLAVVQTGALPIGANAIGTVSLNAALPAGTALIGSIKISDGTDTLGINTNGSLGIVNQKADGTEIFTTTNPGSVNIQSALPAGTNLVGYVKLSNGTYSAGVATDGSTYHINRNASSVEIFTATTPGNVKITDGTHPMAINANGATSNVPYGSNGTELFTTGNPANTAIQSAAIALPTDIQAIFKSECFYNTTPLASNAVFTSSNYDATNNRYAVGFMYSDQASTYRFEHSYDGVNWVWGTSGSLTASTGKSYTEPLFCKYVRMVVTNGATAQTGARYYMTLTPN